MSTDGPIDHPVTAAIEAAEEICDQGEDWIDEKPRLLIDVVNPDLTVAALRDVLANSSVLYERGVPVRLAFDQRRRCTIVEEMASDALVLLAHQVCRPYVRKETPGGIVERDARLPRDIAAMYLCWRGEWRLPVLNGIASGPLLQDDGEISSTDGYDPTSGMWCENVLDLANRLPDKPAREEAVAALRLIREVFATFCFADSDMILDNSTSVRVDTTQQPGRDESAFLVALLTAVCRPSLPLAPAILVRAAPVSGAGAGKGLLARCMSLIAFGRQPHAVTGGSSTEELEKRVSAELMESGPILFIDNLNDKAVRSDLLASTITERPTRIRLLGRSQMVELNAAAFVVLTGNGVTVSEDLARRFLVIELDPRVEDAEARSFTIDIQAQVTARRQELLAALLTIWRWGRQTSDLQAGRVLGSFEQWGRWVRDPLIALGCQDPAERIAEAKQRDGQRQRMAEVFRIWWEHHGDRPVTAQKLNDAIKQLLNPLGRERQYIAAQLEKLAGTRLAGFVLTRQAPASRWDPATYALIGSGQADGPQHHRKQAGEEPRQRPEAPHETDASGQPHACGHSTGMPHGDGQSVTDSQFAAITDVLGRAENHRQHRGHRALGEPRHPTNGAYDPYGAYGFGDQGATVSDNGDPPVWRRRL